VPTVPAVSDAGTICCAKNFQRALPPEIQFSKNTWFYNGFSPFRQLAFRKLKGICPTTLTINRKENKL
jgi:hypothetical protein